MQRAQLSQTCRRICAELLLCTQLRRLARFPAAISSDEELLHCSLVPLNTYPWPIGNVNLPFLYPDGLLQNGACVVEVLQAVTGRAGGQEMHAHLREDMARQRESRGLGQRSRPQPAGHAPDLHGVGHPVVAGATSRLFCRSCGPHQFSPMQTGVLASSAIRAWPTKSSARVGSSIQYSPSSSRMRTRSRAPVTESDWL